MNVILGFEEFKSYKLTFLEIYAKYLHQAELMEYSKCVSFFDKNKEITDRIFDYFVEKFRPNLEIDLEGGRKIAKDNLLSKISSMENVEESVCLKLFVYAVCATVRTNFYKYVKENIGSYALSIKIKPQIFENFPKPHLFAEIFVLGDDFQAIHIRGGKFARGGIRWSERLEDFRTEVMGLAKAQILKNGLIVPTGAKGGFVITKGETNRDHAILCYEKFLCGMLDVTDNIVNGHIITPEYLTVYDDTDPYLVVAADKGTSDFSDIANEVSLRYGYWLGDAFASGGKNGYDHKKIGITAKGVGESVKRSFYELSMSTEKNFSAVGIGSMYGDVFGNGMLLYENMLLIAAFSGEYIFVDPNPNAESSFAVRHHMFNSGKGLWTDYPLDKISAGGGVFLKSDNNIAVSKEMAIALDLPSDKKTISGEELIRYILMAKVDLLWNGGIGTFVKATEESHEHVKDSLNNNIRINASELRAKVFAEGGNLGMTSLGRLEYSKKGGMCYTDALDNSAGVDCSDHEVNIKIALQVALSSNKINFEEYTENLQSYQESVENSVLKDNKRQTFAISVIGEDHSSRFAYSVSALVDKLKDSNILDTEVVYFPTNEEIAMRLKQGGKLFYKPELCTVFASGKIYTKNLLEVCSPKLYHSDKVQDLLYSYFPSELVDSYREEVHSHYLNKKLCATQVSNIINDYLGVCFVNDVISITKASSEDVFHLCLNLITFSKVEDIWETLLMETDNKVSHEVRYMAMNKISESFLHAVSILALLYENGSTIESFGVSAMQYIGDIYYKEEIMKSIFGDSFVDLISTYEKGGIDTNLAQKIAGLSFLSELIVFLLAVKDPSEENLQKNLLYFAMVRKNLHFPVISNINIVDKVQSYNDFCDICRTRGEFLLQYWRLCNVVFAKITSGYTMQEVSDTLVQNFDADINFNTQSDILFAFRHLYNVSAAFEKELLSSSAYNG